MREENGFSNPLVLLMVKTSSHNEDRRRRADSWLAQSEKVDSDDEKFIFLWIAFNAAYGGEPGNTPESDVLGKFLDKILNRDNKKSMEKILFENISPTLFHQIMQNKYMFEPFWQSVRRETGKETWKKNSTKIMRMPSDTIKTVGPNKTAGPNLSSKKSSSDCIRYAIRFSTAAQRLLPARAVTSFGTVSKLWPGWCRQSWQS